MEFFNVSNYFVFNFTICITIKCKNIDFSWFRGIKNEKQMTFVHQKIENTQLASMGSFMLVGKIGIWFLYKTQNNLCFPTYLQTDTKTTYTSFRANCA